MVFHHLHRLEQTIPWHYPFLIRGIVPAQSAGSFGVIVFGVGRIIHDEVTCNDGWGGLTSAPHALRFLLLVNMRYNGLYLSEKLLVSHSL